MIKPFDKNNVFTYVDNNINDKYNMKDGANLLELTGGKKERWTSVSENGPTTFDNSPKISYNVAGRKIFPKYDLPNAKKIPNKDFSPIIPPTINTDKYNINLEPLSSFRNTIKTKYDKILNITWEKNNNTIEYFIVSFTSSIGQQNIKTKENYVNISGLQTGKYTFCVYAVNMVEHSMTDLFEVIIP
jgi:predicted phage tail protein